MNKEKAIGFALIIIGLIFGIEGTAMSFFGIFSMGKVNEAIALSSVFETAMDTSFFQMLQVVISVLIGYSLLKTIAGIACILLGYKAVKGKK